MRLIYPLLALPTILFLLSLPSVHSSNKILTLGVFVSGINTTGSFTGDNMQGMPFVEAVDLAVDLINKDSSLLPDYILEYETTDAQVMFYNSS